MWGFQKGMPGNAQTIKAMIIAKNEYDIEWSIVRALGANGQHTCEPSDQE